MNYQDNETLLPLDDEEEYINFRNEFWEMLSEYDEKYNEDYA